MSASMFWLYTLPSDDLIYRLQPTITASAEDPAYPATNWYDVEPAKPAKLTTTANGWWVFDFGEPVNVAAIGLFYHNFDPGLDVALQWNSIDSWASPMGSVNITIPAWRPDGWSVSPWMEVLGSPTAQFFRLKMGDASPGNTDAFSLGRPLLAGALRESATDVRWEATEIGDHPVIADETYGGVKKIADIFGPRRTFVGEFGLDDDTAETVIALHQSAHNSVLPWMLIRNENVNEACIVQFEETTYSRTFVTVDFNTLPFRAKELSRGLPWP